MALQLSEVGRNALGRSVYPPFDNASRTACLVKVKLAKAKPIRKGGYSDIHLGELADGVDAGRAVALKLMRFVQPQNTALVPEDPAVAVTTSVDPAGSIGAQAPKAETDDNALLWKEARIMRSLDHQNIVRFLGLYEDAEKPGDVFIVMPWVGPCVKGVWHSYALLDYTRANVAANRYQLMFDVASAIAYLHTMSDSDGAQLVHGDLHQGNVLIDVTVDKYNDRVRAKVADFGLCKVIPAGKLASNSLRPGSDRDGVILAPELHLASPTDAYPALRTAGTDVYAYGVLVYTAYNNNTPFAEKKHWQIISDMCQHQARPGRPETIPGGQTLTDGVWNLVTACWQHDPACRPTMDAVLDQLRKSAPPGVCALD